MKECSKSIIRRIREPNFANHYFVGDGLDVGGGLDPLWLYREFFPRMTAARIWDKEDGNAQILSGVEDQSLDFIHSSHCLEHLQDPTEGLKNWFRVVKPGGHLVVTVPEEDLYEQGQFPSTFNRDHKWTFTINKAKSWSSKSVNMLELVSNLGTEAEILKIQKLDESFRYSLPRFDQTLTPIGECGIELVVRKRPKNEIEQGGRMPKRGVVSKMEATLLTGYNFG